MNNNYELVEINTDLDHIHLLIGLSPQDSIPVVMKTLKGVSARLLNSKHKDELSKVLYGGHIWSPSYYIATTSDNVMKNIKQYIIHQGDVDKRKG
jgi:putative transposase